MNLTNVQITSTLLVVLWALPLALGIALTVKRWESFLLRIAPWSALAAVVAAIGISSEKTISFSWLLLEMRLGFDPTGRMFLFFTSLLWLLSGIFAQSYLASDPKRSRFFLFFLLSMAGNFGLIVSHDVVSFYAFFALMSFASYGLVVHNGDAEALQAGRIYIYLVVIGEVLLFTAFVWQAWSVNSLLIEDVARGRSNVFIVSLIFIGFGIKAGALPLHVWLPLAHPAAPTPASAVLSGAMIKAGLLGWLRFLPIGLAAMPRWGAVFVIAGLLAAFYAVIVGLTQRNPKTILAYSSISQMGLMTVGVGMAVGWPQTAALAIPAVALYAVHHGFAKGALFLGVGVLAAGKDHRILYLLSLTGLILVSLAMAGAPFTSGAVAKIALKLPLKSIQETWINALNYLLLLSATGTTLLLARFLFIMTRASKGHDRPHLGVWLSWFSTITLSTVAVWLLPTAQEAVSIALRPAALWSSLWPVVIGTIISGIVWIAWVRGQWRLTYRIPQGDLLVVVTNLFRVCYSWSRMQAPRIQHMTDKLKKDLQRYKPKKGIFHQLVGWVESRLVNWETAGLIFIFLIGSIFVLSIHF